MYPVTSDFLDKMRADKRQVFAKVQIDYYYSEKFVL